MKAVEGSGTNPPTATATITVTVVGPPHTYAISGADNIAINGQETYTLTATDVNGAVPAMQTGCYTVNLRSLQAESSNDVSVAGTSCSQGNKGMLDAMGMMTFTVFAPVNVPPGSAGRIVVLDPKNKVVAQQTVTFGVAPTATPDPTTDPTPLPNSSPRALSNAPPDRVAVRGRQRDPQRVRPVPGRQRR